MNHIQQNRLTRPMFHWLFFLFLSAGFYASPQSWFIEKPLAVENVFAKNRAHSSTKHIAIYPVSPNRNVAFQSQKLPYPTLICLSRNLDNLVKLALIKQTEETVFLPQDLLLHFQSRILSSGDDDSLS
jgi:hypothetical protein